MFNLFKNKNYLIKYFLKDVRVIAPPPLPSSHQQAQTQQSQRKVLATTTNTNQAQTQSQPQQQQQQQQQAQQVVPTIQTTKAQNINKSNNNSNYKNQVPTTVKQTK